MYVQAGTIYASVSSGESKGLVWYRVMSEQVVVIGGFTRLNSGTVIKVYMRAWIGDVVGFGVVAAVDLLANINTPIVQGSATVTVSAVNDMFVSGVVGNDNVVGQLTMQYVGDSFIRFVINPPFTTTYGSSIKLYTSKTLRPSSLFNPTSSCTLNGTIQSCSITTYPSYTLITISSSLITNIYPQSQATTVQINNILLTGISSWSAASFQLYF